MPTAEGQPKSKRSAGHRLNKKVLEAQAAVTMNSLWQDVQKSEAELNNGNQWALEQFIQAAGTMIETFRLAKNNFSRTRVSYSFQIWLTSGHHSYHQETQKYGQ